MSGIAQPIFRPIYGPIAQAIYAARVGGGAAPFSPNAAFFAGRKGYAFDFKNPSTLFQSTDGTGAVASLNDPIGYVTDLSGNANHATQSGALRPLFDPANGAVLDGTRNMLTPSINLSASSSVTVIACVEINTPGNNCVVSHGSFNTGDFRLAYTSAQGNILVCALEGGSPYSSNARAGLKSSFAVVTAVINLLDASEQVYARCNGSLSGNTPGGAASASTLLANRVDKLFGTYYGNMTGKCVRIIVIEGLLTVDELFQSEKWCGDAGGVPIIPEIPISGQPDYGMLNSYGQSLSTGSYGTPIQSALNRFGDLMFSGLVRAFTGNGGVGDYDSLIPLVESITPDISATPQGESPVSGTAEMIHEQGYAGKYFIGTSSGFPSLTISQLSKGSSTYNHFIDAVKNGSLRSRELGKSFKLLAYTWMQGESDGGNVSYASVLNTLNQNLNTDVKDSTLQTDDVWCLSYQLDTPDIGLALLQAQETYSRIVLALPMYFIEHIAAGVHLTGFGAKITGAYFGLAYSRVVVNGDTAWKPLMATSSNVSGPNVDLTYNKPGLVFDTSIVPAQANKGFRLVDSGGSPLAISSVTITGPNTVRITAAAAIPVGAKVYIGFADPTSHTNNVSKTNLRDSQGDTIVFNGGGLNYPMHNWALLQTVSL